MKIGKFSFLLIALSLLVSTISACSPSRVLVEDYDQVPAGAATTEPETPEESVPESVEDQGPAPVEEDEGNNLDDVPIMNEAYQVQKGSKTIIYQVDGNIEEVVTYYQDELPNYEWEMARPPDTAVGAIATMLRENAAGDRLAINMQANELGGFVRVNITISRAN